MSDVAFALFSVFAEGGFYDLGKLVVFVSENGNLVETLKEGIVGNLLDFLCDFSVLRPYRP